MLERCERFLTATEVPLSVAQDVEETRRAVRLHALIDLRHRSAREHFVPRAVALELVVHRSAGQELRPVHPRHLLGVRNSIEQLHRLLEQRGGLTVGVHMLGGLGRADCGAQRRRSVTRGREVVGDRRGKVRTHSVSLGAQLERLRQTQIDGPALAGEQVVADNFA